VLYYYDIDNITESRLPPHFCGCRCEVGNDNVAASAVYGLEDGELLIKNLGSVLAKEDRILVFPNIFKHRIDRFELLDPTKPGHRKILCFFITDPNNPHIVCH
jgi:hypothetical protein